MVVRVESNPSKHYNKLKWADNPKLLHAFQKLQEVIDKTGLTVAEVSARLK